MKQIKLNQKSKNKYITIVDNEDFEELNKYRWSMCNGYAKRNQYLKGIDSRKYTVIWMHREINKTPDGMLTDHINRNKLDNRKINLRSVNNSQNIFNTGIKRNNTSGHTGVWKNNENGTWRARIVVNKKYIYLGTHHSFQKAVMTRKAAEILYNKKIYG